MKSIPLTALLVESNVRKQGAGKDDDAGLAASVRELGVLQPIVVREEASGGYRIIFGHRRAQAAKAAGLKDIPAEVIDVPADKIAAMQAAENMVRTGMSELDEWRAMTQLQADGLSLQQAAAAIGVKERDARRLDLLGSMHPDMLALMEEFGVPDREDVLRHIATAPFDVQAKATKAKGVVTGKGMNRAIRWWDIGKACQRQEISARIALFDIDEERKKTGLAFIDDLFAKADDPDRLTTTDIKGFLGAQERAARKLAEDRTAKGAVTLFTTISNGNLVVPDGWGRGYNLWSSDPKDWPKHKDSDGKAVAIAVKRDGYGVGELTACVVEKAVPKAKGAAARDPDAPPPAPKPSISKDGLDMIATIKGDMLRGYFERSADLLGSENLLVALLLALCASNVRVSGRGGTEYGVHDFQDIAAKLVSADGRLDWPVDQLSTFAASVIGRIIGFDTPKARGRSGPVADVLARAYDVPLPRFDTAEFLATVHGETIRALAKEAGVAPSIKKVSDLRAALVGKLPDWRPAEAEFAADWKPKSIDAVLHGDGEDEGDDEDEDAEREAA